MPTLLEVAAEVYALGPGEMIAARDARARDLRTSDEDLARRVRALRKPSTAAWVVNLLARREPALVEQVVALGAALRGAQVDLDAPRLRELTAQRRHLTAAVTGRARELAADAGVIVSAAVATQVEATLTAAMIDDDAGRAVRGGLLVAALHATGVGRADVASAVAVPDELGIAPVDDASPRHLRAVPDPPRRPAKDAADQDAARAPAQARQALADAEEDVAAAERDRVAADSEVARLDAAAQRLDAERVTLRDRLVALEDEVAAVGAARRGAEKVRRRAERTVTDAVRRREVAAERVRALAPGER